MLPLASKQARKFITREGEKYYRSAKPIGRNPHGYWLPESGKDNGMDAPFLNWHRDAKVEVQSNHS
jgi:hypothetical protein